MGIFQVQNAHSLLAAIGSDKRFQFYELADASGTYAVAALAEHEDCLELHLEVLRFGPCAVRALQGDVAELKHMARQLGKKRIVGLRMENDLHVDLRWPKFTRLFGFTGQRVYQTAELSLE